MNPIEALMETATPLQRKLLGGCRYVEETGCWEWVGNEYGKVHLDGTRKNPTVRTLSFEEFIGPLMWDDGITTRCGNKKCICPTHMDIIKSLPDGYWTKDRCAEEALKYETRSSFAKKCDNSAAYVIAQRNGWLDDICGHMKQGKKPDGYWTKDRCAEEALKYDTRTSFRKMGGSPYYTAHRNGWLDDICGHMAVSVMPKGYWTKNRCAEEALKYETRGKFSKMSGSAYATSLRNGWLDEFFPKPA